MESSWPKLKMAMGWKGRVCDYIDSWECKEDTSFSLPKPKSPIFQKHKVFQHYPQYPSNCWWWIIFNGLWLCRWSGRVQNACVPLPLTSNCHAKGWCKAHLWHSKQIACISQNSHISSLPGILVHHIQRMQQRYSSLVGKKWAPASDTSSAPLRVELTVISLV